MAVVTEPVYREATAGMTQRELPKHEWPRLVGTELEAVMSTLPEDVKVVVVEDESGAIIGCWAAMPVMHVEGVWIAPAHRGRTAVARRLWSGMRQTLASFGAAGAWTAAVAPDVAALLGKRATRVEGQHYLLSWRKA